MAAFICAVFILFSDLDGRPLAPGWTSPLRVVLLLGVQLFTLGIASEHIARLYNEYMCLKNGI
jgi:hypothetical protein